MADAAEAEAFDPIEMDSTTCLADPMGCAMNLQAKQNVETAHQETLALSKAKASNKARKRKRPAAGYERKKPKFEAEEAHLFVWPGVIMGGAWLQLALKLYLAPQDFARLATSSRVGSRLLAMCREQDAGEKLDLILSGLTKLQSITRIHLYRGMPLDTEFLMKKGYKVAQIHSDHGTYMTMQEMIRRVQVQISQGFQLFNATVPGDHECDEGSPTDIINIEVGELDRWLRKVHDTQLALNQANILLEKNKAYVQELSRRLSECPSCSRADRVSFHEDK
jgi:hypothetical protein